MEMDRSNRLGSALYAETVLEHSAVFEYLGHSKAFEQVMLDNVTSRVDSLKIDKIAVPRVLVPENIIEWHGYPPQFNVEALEATLTSFPKTKNCEDAWSFMANYEVNFRKYYVHATKDSVVSNYFDSNGGRHEHTFDHGTGMLFVRTLALGLFHEQGNDLFGDETPVATPESEEELRRLMRMMGSMKGEYKATLSSYIKGTPNTNRGIIVHNTETESPTESGLSIDYKMIWEVADGKPTEVASHQEEVIDSALEGMSWSVRYTERKPTETGIDDLPYSLTELDNSGVEKSVFMQDCDNLLYEIANTSIMTIIVPHMRKYLHLDQDTPTDIFEIKKSEELTN